MNNDTNVVYLAKLHWIIFIWPIFFFFLSLAMGFYFPLFHIVALVFLGFSLLWFGITWMTYLFTSLTIKKKQVILRTGFFVRYTTDIPLAKIESMDIRQSIIGSFLHYGSLVIIGTGGTRYVIDRLNKPLICRRYIEQLMQDVDAVNA